MDDDIDDFDDADLIAAADATSARLDGPSRPVQGASGVQQPKPQALPSRNAPSSILVSTRQKGNPILNHVRALPWEYSDIAADYVLGATTCALFLSLKYHRLHPEYIYSRIRALQGSYNLRIILTMVDIDNHEEPLKELSKTSLINHVTVILCWSAQEAGRYLELFKSFENAQPTSIRAQQSTAYADRLVDFITLPRGVNKTDALGLVSTFGSVRTAVNARPEEIALVAGWGEKKVQRWCNTVRMPFRAKKAAKRTISRDVSRADAEAPEEPREVTRQDQETAVRLGIASQLPKDMLPPASAPSEPGQPVAGHDPDDDEEMAFLEASNNAVPQASTRSKKTDFVPNDAITAALAKYRNEG